MTGYEEIYSAYLRSRRRRTITDIETLDGVATLLSIENLTLLKLRKLIYERRKRNQ